MAKKEAKKRRSSPASGDPTELKDYSRLATELETTNPFLYLRADRVFQIAEKEFYAHQTPPGFTDHGLRHITKVLQFADEITEGRHSSELFTMGELYLLLVSMLLHDVGRLADDYSYLDSRSHHGQESETIIREQQSKFELNEHEANIVGTICKSHCVGDYRALSKREWSVDSIGRCDLHAIMSILRIADLLDLTYSRAPSFVFRLKKLHHTNRKHWNRHQCISDVVVDRERADFVIYARPTSIKQHEDIFRYCGWVDSQVKAVREDFSRIGLNFVGARLEEDITAFSNPANPTPAANPYPRLSPFTASDADLFFGRDSELEEILELSERHPFLSVTGYSGVGKTSLIEAGVLPQLMSNGVSIATFRLRSPLDAKFLEVLGSTLALESDCSRAAIAESMGRMRSEGKSVCIHIDQFEELFTLSFTKADKAALIEVLGTFLSDPRCSGLRVIATIRADFLAHLWEMRLSNPLFFATENLYWVKIFDPAEARQAMEKPLLRFSNLRWHDNLVKKLIFDLPDIETPGIYPPYLSLVCHTLLENKFKHISQLSLDERNAEFVIDEDLYRSIGPAKKIVQDYFKTILDGFTMQEREVIDSVLTKMVTDFGSKKPISDEAAEEINQDRIDIGAVMNRLIRARVVTRGFGGYELEHDLLAKQLITIIRSGAKASSLVLDVIGYMREQKHERITLDALARIANLSKSQLNRRFKAETDSAPLEYLWRVRIEEAKLILRDSQDSVETVALKCGFRSLSHFNQVFRRLQDEKPLTYRKKAREAHKIEFA